MTSRRALFGAIAGLVSAPALIAKRRQPPTVGEIHLSRKPNGEYVTWNIMRTWDEERQWTKVVARREIDGHLYGMAIAYTPHDLAHYPAMVARRHEHLRRSLDTDTLYWDEPRKRKEK